MTTRRPPGQIRDAIVEAFGKEKRPLSVEELHKSVNKQLGEEVARSSIRSYLRLNTPDRFERVGRGQYRLLR